MANFKFGYHHVDKHLFFNKNDLIVIASRPGMGLTTLMLNVLFRSNQKVCYISLRETNQKAKIKLDKIRKSYNAIDKVKNLVNIELFDENNFEYNFLELPTLVDLLEFITLRVDYFDCFIIDELTDIDTDINSLFNKNKNYQSILRNLKVICNLSNKNVVLLSSLDRLVEKKNISYYSKFGHYNSFAKKEKYIDYLFTLFRPDYYDLKKDEIDEIYDKNHALLSVSKFKKELTEYDFSLTFDSDNLLFF